MHHNLIAGEWLAGTGLRRNINPSDTSDLVGEYAHADAAQTERAIQAARQAFPAWSRGSVQARADALEKIAAELLADAKVDVIGWSGTAAGWLGFDADLRLCERIEERTGIRARHYAAAHGDAIETHLIGAESDFGAGRIYAFNTGAPDHARKATEQIAQALAPLGIEYAPGKGSAGPDISPFAAKGMAWGWLAQDGSDYFDLHHNADDTLDKIDPAALAQNVAAYTVFAYLAAEAEGDFGSRLKE